jgi:hypothetical protein
MNISGSTLEYNSTTWQYYKSVLLITVKQKPNKYCWQQAVFTKTQKEFQNSQPKLNLIEMIHLSELKLETTVQPDGLFKP